MVLTERQWPSLGAIMLSLIVPVMLTVAYGAATTPLIGAIIGVLGLLIVLLVVFLTTPIVSLNDEVFCVGGAILPRYTIQSVVLMPATDVDALLQTDARYFTAIRGSAPEVLCLRIADSNDPHVGWIIRLRSAAAFALALSTK